MLNKPHSYIDLISYLFQLTVCGTSMRKLSAACLVEGARRQSAGRGLRRSTTEGWSAPGPPLLNPATPMRVQTMVGLFYIPFIMRQVLPKCDINIAVNDHSWWRLRTKNRPLTVLFISCSRGTCLISLMQNSLSLQ